MTREFSLLTCLISIKSKVRASFLTSTEVIREKGGRKSLKIIRLKTFMESICSLRLTESNSEWE
jgi:hypothetical protein